MLFALRSAKNLSTGLTPAFANLGRELKSPIDLFLPDPNLDAKFTSNVREYAKKLEHKIKSSLNFLLENRELAQAEQKIYYDPHHKQIEFNEGEWVTLQAHPLSNKAKGVSASLSQKREGPYLILNKMNPLNYELGDVNSKLPITFAHIVQLRKYEPRDDSPVLTDKPELKRISFNPTKIGLGKTRGRPKGIPNTAPTVIEPTLREEGPITRSQAALVK
jgi:hypothetical protein